jgi:hypothetical protein
MHWIERVHCCIILPEWDGTSSQPNFSGIMKWLRFDHGHGSTNLAQSCWNSLAESYSGRNFLMQAYQSRQRVSGISVKVGFQFLETVV